MSTLCLVCGISGSGKTTFSKKFVQNHSKYLYVNPDELYALFNGSELRRNHAFEVWQTLFLIVHTAETDGRDVIIDTNALTAKHRAQFLEWFPNFESYQCYEVNATKEQRHYNNANRYRVVPENVLSHMEMEYETVSEDEGWNVITRIYNNGKGGFDYKLE